MKLRRLLFSTSWIWIWILLLILEQSSVEVEGARILVLTFISMISHKNVYSPLMEELAKRGHDITIISPVPVNSSNNSNKKPIKNIREIFTLDLDKAAQKMGLPLPNFFELKESKLSVLAVNPFMMASYLDPACRLSFALPQVKEVTAEKYDLVFLSSFLNECTYGIAHHMNTSTILYNTIAAFPWTVGNFGGPNPPSFVPSPFFRLTQEMNYFERLFNMAALMWVYLSKRLLYEPTFERTYREFVRANLPSVAEIERNASLILSNSHFSLNYPRPLMPDVIDVGGMHCRPAQQLPKDLNDFLSASAKDGFVYFSMGSGMKAHTMPEKYQRIFLNTFAKLKQRVLWKYETDDLEEELPANVKICKWCPQQDILGHPNIKVFLTHGGLLSTQEAVYHGVPLVGIPMFGDQMWNMLQSETSGIGLTLEFTKLSQDELSKALHRVIQDKTFKEKAQELSTIFRDQPQTPLQRAAFWVEYVLRHKGAVHLRSAGRELSFFQYYSLDVLGTIGFLLCLMLYLNYLLARTVIRKIWWGKGPKKGPGPKTRTKVRGSKSDAFIVNKKNM